MCDASATVLSTPRDTASPRLRSQVGILINPILEVVQLWSDLAGSRGAGGLPLALWAGPGVAPPLRGARLGGLKPPQVSQRLQGRVQPILTAALLRT